MIFKNRFVDILIASNDELFCFICNIMNYLRVLYIELNKRAD